MVPSGAAAITPTASTFATPPLTPKPVVAHHDPSARAEPATAAAMTPRRAILQGMRQTLRGKRYEVVGRELDLRGRRGRRASAGRAKDARCDAECSDEDLRLPSYADGHAVSPPSIAIAAP